MLNNIFGRSPTEAFEGLVETAIQRVWQSAVSDKAALKKSFEDVVLSRLVESRIAEESGPCLPLKTWADAPCHFDVEHIKKKAPMRARPILGDTYQVKIVTTGDKLQRDMVREQEARMTSECGSASSAMAAQGTDNASDEEEHSTVRGANDATTSSEASGSDSSSSDDESSDSGKKRMAPKKSKGNKSKKTHKAKETSDRKVKAKEAERAKKAAQKEKNASGCVRKHHVRLIKRKWPASDTSRCTATKPSQKPRP